MADRFKRRVIWEIAFMPPYITGRLSTLHPIYKLQQFYGSYNVALNYNWKT